MNALFHLWYRPNKRADDAIPPVTQWSDSENMIANIRSLNPKIEERRLLVQLEAMKEACRRNELTSVRWKATQTIYVDCFTKDMDDRMLRLVAMGNRIYVKSKLLPIRNPRATIGKPAI